MPPSAVAAGAAPVWVGERLAGPAHDGTVVHSGEDAVYVDSGGDVIGIVSRHATPVPCAISTRADSVGDLLSGHRPSVGDRVRIGSGAITLDGHRVRVSRYVDFAMQSFDRAQAPQVLARLLAATRGDDLAAGTELDPETVALLRERPAAALDRAVGRGSGLTPFGDDVVCGLLATLLAVEDPCAPQLRRECRALAPGRTTSLSATLLHRAGEGERDSSVLVALARLDGVPCVVVGQDKDAQTPEDPMGPGALREARRGMKLAQELDLPLVTFIDTPGAELSQEAEERSIGGEIARCIATMSTMTVPTVSVLLGEGTGGGALALLPADITIAAQHSWLAPLPPEGASAIVHGHVEAAAEMAELQQVSSIELMRQGVVDHLVAEFDDDTPQDLASAVAAEVSHWLRELRARA